MSPSKKRSQEKSEKFAESYQCLFVAPELLSIRLILKYQMYSHSKIVCRWVVTSLTLESRLSHMALSSSKGRTYSFLWSIHEIEKFYSMASDTSFLQSSFFISVKCLRQVPLDFGPLAIEGFQNGENSRGHFKFPLVVRLFVLVC